jgi:hypothetical protein
MIKLDLRSERTVYYKASRDRIYPLSRCDFKLNHDLAMGLQSDFVYNSVYAIPNDGMTDEYLEKECNNVEYDLYKTVEYKLILDGPDFEYVEDTMKRLLNRRPEENELYVALSKILDRKVMNAHTAHNRSLDRYGFTSIRYMQRRHVIWVAVAEPLTYISKANPDPVLKDSYKLKLYKNLMETQLLSALSTLGLEELSVSSCPVTLRDGKLTAAISVRKVFRDELKRVLAIHMDAILKDMFNGELLNIFEAFSLDKQKFIEDIMFEATNIHSADIKINDTSFD